MTKAKDILREFSSILEHLSGDLESQAQQACSIEHIKKSSLVYVHKTESLKAVLDSGASIVIIDKKLATSQAKVLQSAKTNIALFASDQLAYAMALINTKFFPVTDYADFANEKNIHPTAVISATAKLGSGCIIGPNVSIGEHVVLGKNCLVGANTVIEKNAQIGDDSHIHALVYIGHNSQLGKFCIVQAHTAIGSNGFGYGSNKSGEHFYKPHYGRVILQDRVEVGANVSIDRGTFEDTIIGEGTKIDNQCHLAHNFICGKNCLITANFLTAGSVKIGDNCIFGGRTSINGHTHITNNVTMAALSASAGHVEESGVYGGWPLQAYRDNLKTLASLPHLADLRKEIAAIRKKLNLDTE